MSDLGLMMFLIGRVKHPNPEVEALLAGECESNLKRANVFLLYPLNPNDLQIVP